MAQPGAQSGEKILVVSGEPTRVASMAALFVDRGYQVVKAYTGNDGIRTAEVHEPDVILLDLDLPDLNGFDVCRNLRLRNTTWSIPIILLALKEVGADELIMKGLEMGANDYVKSLNKVELLGRVGVMLRMKRVEDKLRRLYIERTRELEWSNMELQTIRTQLIVKNQMSTLGLMVAVAAHEIRSPAASISGNLELINALLRELTECLATLPGTFREGPPEDLAQVYRLMALVVDLALREAPLDLHSRRKEARRIEGLLEDRGAEGRPDLAPQLAKLRMGEPEVLDVLLPLIRRYGDGFLTALVTLGELIIKLRNMKISIERINTIVSSMKDYTHVDRDQLSDFHLHEGLDDTLTIMSYIFKGGVEVEKRYTDDLPLVQGHPGELNQVWTNMLQNAYDAMDGKGRIIVATLAQEHNGHVGVAVRITDNGGGIPPDVLPHIFDSFFTTKDKGRGSGLGLDICKRIIEKHGGAIDVRSSPGETTFTVWLPVSANQRRREPSPP